MKHKQFDFRTAYIDLLLNVLTGIVFLFILTTMMIHPKKEEDGIKKDAQYIITAQWDSDSDCDVDLWVQDPFNNVAYFQQKDVGLMHLERDDLGHLGDEIYDAQGNKLSSNDENIETWVLRGRLKGEFTVNVHLYACRREARTVNIGEPMDLDVEVTLTKLNPRVVTVKKERVHFSAIWDELTAFNFILNEQAAVESITHNFKSLLNRRKNP